MKVWEVEAAHLGEPSAQPARSYSSFSSGLMSSHTVATSESGSDSASSPWMRWLLLCRIISFLNLSATSWLVLAYLAKPRDWPDLNHVQSSLTSWSFSPSFQ